MTRFRLYPTRPQERQLVEYCAHARFVWNLALEQANMYRPAIGPTPDFRERSKQLTEARAEFAWLHRSPRIVQQHALRDFDQAMRNWWAHTHHRPTWRKLGINDGFRVHRETLPIRKANDRWSEVRIPNLGWVRFRTSREVPEAKSYRVTLDQAGRWHIAFAAIPEPLDGPGDGSVVGIDRGIAITLALSDGSRFQAPAPRSLGRLQRNVARCQRGSNRRKRAKARLARAHARNADRRKDWVEKSSTTIARSYDLIRIENLKVKNMTRSGRGKRGLNRSILEQGWGQFATRLEHKASGRVEKVNSAYTSQTCSACSTRDREARESQAVFRCRACGYTDNADVNAAKNIAAGYAVTARRGLGVIDPPLKREPRSGGCQARGVLGAET